MLKNTNDKFQVGFTLIELLFAVLLLGILIGIAAPSMQNTLRKNSVESHVQNLRSAINFARSEAASKGALLVVCGNDGSGTNCTGDGDWSLGWIVYVDRSIAEPYVENIEAGDEIVRVFDYQGGSSLKVTEEDAATELAVLAFNSQGYVRNLQAALFKACPNNNEQKYARGVVISPAGRALLTRDTNGDQIHDHVTDDGLGVVTSVQSNPLACP